MNEPRESDWVYKIIVPAEKVNDFVRAMLANGLFSDDNIDLEQEGE